MLYSFGIAAVVVMGAVGAGAEGDDWAVGEAAPPLVDLVWHRGEAVEGFEAGKVYLLEFWSTWCAPCISMIPANNALAAERAEDGLVVVGIHVLPREEAPAVEDFLASSDRGVYPAMEYAVAEDKQGDVEQVYMRELHGLGLPATAIVDRQGRLAWIGLTSAGADEALDAVLDGSFDIEAEAVRYKQARLANQKLNESIQARRAGEFKRAGALFIECIEAKPGLYDPIAPSIYVMIATENEDQAVAVAFGEALLVSPLRENADVLDGLANAILEHLPADAQHLNVALSAAERACELTHNLDADFNETLHTVRTAIESEDPR